MLSLSPSVRIYVCLTPTDMRRQFDGLAALVKHTFERDIFTGDYFVFLNRAADRCKILCWDRDGYCLWSKRLELGRFQIPAFDGVSLLAEIDGTTLAMILGGVDLQSVKRRKRYQRPPRDAVAQAPAISIA